MQRLAVWASNIRMYLVFYTPTTKINNIFAPKVGTCCESVGGVKTSWEILLGQQHASLLPDRLSSYDTGGAGSIQAHHHHRQRDATTRRDKGLRKHT